MESYFKSVRTKEIKVVDDSAAFIFRGFEKQKLINAGHDKDELYHVILK